MKIKQLTMAVLVGIALTQTVSASAFPARMRENEKGLVVVDFADRSPSRVTHTPVDTLPEPDSYLIRQGIILRDKNSYTKAMEDFCS